MDSTNQLSPAGAWLMGAAFVACGLPSILIADGIIVPAHQPSDSTPPWVLFCVGLMFVVAGVVIVIDYAIARVSVDPGGDFVAGTPMAVRLMNLLLGAMILGSMTAVFGWVAFGRGPRHFSSTLYIPLLGAAFNERASEISGRIAFGAVTVLMAAMFVACGVVGIRRLRRVR